MVFTLKQEVDTDMFEFLSSTEGQDSSTEQGIMKFIKIILLYNGTQGGKQNI